MINQLTQIWAKISLSLMINSELHKKILRPTSSITCPWKNLKVSLVTSLPIITLPFTNDEILVEEARQNNALHISVKCMNHILEKVLVESDAKSTTCKTVIWWIRHEAKHYGSQSFWWVTWRSDFKDKFINPDLPYYLWGSIPNAHQLIVAFREDLGSIVQGLPSNDKVKNTFITLLEGHAA